jgi:hypothetical protein
MLLAAALACLAPALAAEPQKPLVSLTVKRHTLDSDRDMIGRKGSTRTKTVALRVEIVNTSPASVAESELAGDVLVERTRNQKQIVVREPLGKIKLPAMKPNEKLTLDLGKIELSEVEWQNRKIEETLEEWQVTCNQGTTKIGKATSSERYHTLLKDVVAPPKKEVPAGPLRKALRRIGD